MMGLSVHLISLDFLMTDERNYDNDGLDPSEEYFKKKRKSNDDDDTYFPLEESEPPHY